MSDTWRSLLVVDTGGLFLLIVRLLVALALGRLVAVVYRRSRPMGEEAESFVVTLVLLTILIAMVTQVIGDNVARAFSLVGALSIVRFRTVVRDTQDTAYVIFAVAIGMAVGSNHPAVAICGLAVVAFAALVVMKPRSAARPLAAEEPGALTSLLDVRIALGQDAEALLGSTLDQFLSGRTLDSIGTNRQGLAIDVTYAASLRAGESPARLVNALNSLEGVQSVNLRRAQSLDD
jgi:uncharacterized membrane protein YhiD involved in acid resistance